MKRKPIDAARIAEIRRQIAEGEYPTDEQVNATAERLAEILRLKETRQLISEITQEISADTDWLIEVIRARQATQPQRYGCMATKVASGFVVGSCILAGAVLVLVAMCAPSV